ncbi:MAG: glycogen/starch synthase, partial [Bacteroidota bacterium]
MKPKILMLGWEFPPLISGGLGVACKGIADSLSKKVNLTVLVPKIEKNNKFKYKLVGIYNEINKIKDKIQKNNTFNLPKTFSSYYNDSHNEILLKSNEQNKKYDNN